MEMGRKSSHVLIVIEKANMKSLKWDDVQLVTVIFVTTARYEQNKVRVIFLS